MNMQWIATWLWCNGWWLALGIIPYRIQRIPGKQHSLCWRFEAIFWRLELVRKSKRHTKWHWHCPLLVRLKKVVWTAVRVLR